MRTTLAILLGLFATTSLANAAEPAPLRIERMTILTGSDDSLWFQSRGAVIPGQPPRIMVTTQALDRGGVHAFRDISEISSSDNGSTWTAPKVIEPLRRKKNADGDELVAGDLSPQWHAASGTVLATGKMFGFRGGTREDRALERVADCVYSPSTNAWGELRTLDLPVTDHAGRKIVSPNSGCCQRYDLPGGDILLPIRYSAGKVDAPYVTIVALCRFDGTTLIYERHGSELSRAKGRGLYEPSITAFHGRYYVTMRADDSGFVARSSDGLDYEPIVEWTFDDGKPLGSYNTQQHWIAHGDALYLVYTRRGADNDHIFRHRAPLFIAQVDPERLCVVRATEQVLFPEDNASLGNGGVLEVSPNETWFIESELVAGSRQRDCNKVMVARILWAN
ncbi:MAG TPA: sialidase family protein [Pirellulales bacterium]|nr:sialidase family protein [Pirellulales bacterium]